MTDYSKREYYEWKDPMGDKHDYPIPIEYHVLTNRHMTPWWERVFPEDRHLTKIDAERYILVVRNWGRRLYKKLNK
tara:strand:- start:320 stop:547 length:228 start_codon:yes stop_codon:yes gene_type:complete